MQYNPEGAAMTDDPAPRPPLDPAELRAFARRDWGAPERLARAERVARSPERCFELAWELYLAARFACPGWPSEEDRRRDFEHHLAMRALLDRAGHVGRR